MNKKTVFTIIALIAAVNAGFAQKGPGGVESGLKMWLRADSNMTLTTGTVSNYSSPWTIAWQNLGTPSSTQTVVTGWRSIEGNTLYSAKYGDNDRRPVYLQRHYLMNYHPTVDFYTNWGSAALSRDNFSAFLTATNSPMAAQPTQSTTIVIMNAAIKDKNPRTGATYTGENQNSYFIIWHNTEVPTTYTGTNVRPGFGVRTSSGGAGQGQPRLRVNSGASDYINIFEPSFDPGQTTIADYQIKFARTNNINANDARIGYNMHYVYNDGVNHGSGQQTTGSRSTGDWYMNSNSTLGGSRYHTRSLKGMISEVVMYDRLINDNNDDKNAINSYFAMKYGITLARTSGRFDYVKSDGDTIWPGRSGGGIWATYYNNIAMVIRDDSAYLNNRQAHSTDIGSIVHMGAASSSASELYYDGNPSKLGDLEDEEAIAFGNDNVYGVTQVHKECGDFDNIFNRKWLVNKLSENGRDVMMVVAAQNNLGNNLAEGVGGTAMYNALISSNEVYLIVADSPEKLTYGHATFGQFTDVIPMRYINGEHQCVYIFTEDETYFTFGFKADTRGCLSDITFPGTKVLDWSRWTRSFVGSTLSGGRNSVTTKSTSSVSLGDGITVTQTVRYDVGVQASSSGYPRSVTSPRGGIEISRLRGSPNNQKVTVTIEYNHPVMPEFSISGLDVRWRQYDDVLITGYCSTGPGYAPRLSYAGNPSSASYKISGNRATVIKKGSQSATAKNGTVNVAFRGGVSRIVIEYTLRNYTSSVIAQRIYISPISIRAVPPPPPIIDGLSFVKDVKQSDITTCEPVEYSFYIRNTSVTDKYITIKDTLPAGLKWETLTLDSVNYTNPKLYINNDFAGSDKLLMDSILLHCASEIKLTATATIDDNAVPQNTSKPFNNRAAIYYKTADGVAHSRFSLDRMTLNDFTQFTATWAKKQLKVTHTASINAHKYKAGQEVEVTLTVNNPNDAISNMRFDMDWDASFSFVSYTSTASGTYIVPPTDLLPGDPEPLLLMIAGDAQGNDGFLLPHGETVFKFKFHAPDVSHLEREIDDDGQIIPNSYASLNINYLFETEGGTDPCVLESVNSLQGTLRIPYNLVNRIITNRHVTTKIKK